MKNIINCLYSNFSLYTYYRNKFVYSFVSIQIVRKIRRKITNCKYGFIYSSFNSANVARGIADP